LRINLEDTLSAAEGIYLQVLAVQDQLPNPIRKIIGLPEIHEQQQQTSNNSDTNNSSTPSNPDTGIWISSSQNAVTNGNSNGVANNSVSLDELTLENQYEAGINQFM